MGMAEIEDSLKSTLRELVQKIHFDQISTAALCSSAHVSRAAFYSRYNSKEALLADILYDDICKPVLSIRNVIPTVKYGNTAHSLIDDVQCDNILANREFYTAIMRDCPTLFITLLTQGLTAVNETVLVPYDLPDLEKEYMAFFYAANHAMLYRKWIGDGFIVEPSKLINWYFKWAAESWMKVSRELGIGSVREILD